MATSTIANWDRPGPLLFRHFVEHMRGVTAVEAAISRLKVQMAGEIDVGGPDLAGLLADLGLIDEYRLYLRPFVLGRGIPFFSRSRPRLRLVSSDLVGEDAMRLTYVPV